MKPFIVVSDGFDKNLFEGLKNDSNFEVHPEPKISQDKLKELLPKINGLVIRSATKVTPEILEQAPNLKYVIRAGAGTDNIDKVACQEKGVKVSNTPGANSNSAAELAISLMFSVLRKTAIADASMKAGKWEKASFSGNEMANKKLGFVGFGKIGQIVAKRLSGFDITVKYFDPMVTTTDIPYATKVETMEEVFESSEIVTLHLPKIKETTNLITTKYFDMMDNNSIFINAARGGIVNENDLYTALKDGSIKAAGVDVFEQEPADPANKLFTLNNIVVTPHVGASTAEAQIRVGEMAVNQLKEFFVSNNLLNEVRA